MSDESEVCLEGQGLQELPESVVDRHASTVERLDLTDNQLKSGVRLDQLTKLHTLVLDKNQLSALPADMPKLSTVTTLWLNNNLIRDRDALIDQIERKFPKLQYLSLLRNPACPDVYFSDGESEAYQRYRYYIIHRLKNLQFLDATPVTPAERKEAEVRGKFLRVAKPVESEEESKQDHTPIAALSPPSTAEPVKVATFLARGKPRYDGSNSEGNRFICNDDL